MLCMSGEQVANSEFHQVHSTIKKTSREYKKVDINILLNKIRAARKKEKKQQGKTQETVPFSALSQTPLLGHEAEGFFSTKLLLAKKKVQSRADGAWAGVRAPTASET